MPRGLVIFLSVVVATRNDDHGGDPLKRLQAFVNTFAVQCSRSGLDAEIIVVEWNPPTDRPRVRELLRLPSSAPFVVRFVEVPADIHLAFRFGAVLPLFQMIAKNVGIRRARGRFVLATNMDIIFSNELIEYIASRRLEPGILYRVDRHDIQSDFPVDSALDAQMAYCASHQLRIHTRCGSYPADSSGGPVCLPEDVVDGCSVRLGAGWHVREGGGTGHVYRWVNERAELVVNPAGAPIANGGVVEIDVESKYAF